MSKSADTACQGADFCQEFSGVSDTEFRRVYQGDPGERLIGRSEHLSVLADMSPLCVGHILIVPLRHYLSFAEVIGDWESEVKRVTNRILRQYSRIFGNPVILEHGSSYGIKGSSCVTHAHWHVLPLDLEAVLKVTSADDLAWTELDSIGELAAVGRGSAYYYCADQFGRRLYAPERIRRRQYLRSVAGAILGIVDPEWDYAVVTRKEFLRITMAATEDWRIGS